MNFFLNRLKEKSTYVSVFGMLAMCGASVSPEIQAATTEGLPLIAAGATMVANALMAEKTAK